MHCQPDMTPGERIYKERVIYLLPKALPTSNAVFKSMGNRLCLLGGFRRLSDMGSMVEWPVAEALSELEEVDEGSVSYKRNRLAQVHQEFVRPVHAMVGCISGIASSLKVGSVPICEVARASSVLEKLDEGSVSYARSMLAQWHKKFVLVISYHC
jgi:hypothetical protein